ncbi:Plant UBX domain-containing protein 1 [Citrus sinensis]|nr:Plant UBX domain-containing protein 1 [Citrus sinensis]
MFVDGSTPVPLKRRRHTYVDPMEVESAKAKLAAAKEKFGREIRVFETSALSSSPTVVSSSDEPDDFYEFTAEDYYRILATKKEDTTPPKKIIKDMSQDFFSASFIPGAIVYFSYDLPKGDDVVAANSGPFLHEDVMSLKGLEVIAEQPDPVQSAPEPATVIRPPVTQDPKPAEKKSVKPKWLKM